MYADRNLKSLVRKLVRKLSFHVKKSHFVISQPCRRKLKRVVDLEMFDSKTFISLEQKNMKYLGILIDTNLTWKNQICHAASNLSKTISIISKLRHFVPRSILMNIYRFLIFPHW